MEGHSSWRKVFRRQLDGHSILHALCHTCLTSLPLSGVQTRTAPLLPLQLCKNVLPLSGVHVLPPGHPEVPALEEGPR